MIKKHSQAPYDMKCNIFRLRTDESHLGQPRYRKNGKRYDISFLRDWFHFIMTWRCYLRHLISCIYCHTQGSARAVPRYRPVPVEILKIWVPARKKILGTAGYRVPARKKNLGTDGYRVPARKKFLGTDGYRVPGKFSLMPTPGCDNWKNDYNLHKKSKNINFITFEFNYKLKIKINLK